MPPEEQEDDVLELDTELDEQDDENPDSDESDGESDEDGADETLIGFEDEEPLQADDNSVVRRLRDQLEAEKKRRKDAEAKVPKIEVGDKPTLEGCDYDEARFETQLLAYNQRKAEAEAQSKVAEASQDSGREEFGAELAQYAQQKTKLARADFDVAETVVTGRLNEVQQSVLVMASKNKAALIYALGKSPARLDALAEITNPIKLAVAVTEMERNLKVQARKKAPEPQGRMKGGTPASGSVDAKEAKLVAEADKTGDRSKLAAYRREKRLSAK